MIREITLIGLGAFVALLATAVMWWLHPSLCLYVLDWGMEKWCWNTGLLAAFSGAAYGVVMRKSAGFGYPIAASGLTGFAVSWLFYVSAQVPQEVAPFWLMTLSVGSLVATTFTVCVYVVSAIFFWISSDRRFVDAIIRGRP